MTSSSTAPMRKSANTARQARIVRLATSACSSPMARPTPQATPNRPRPTTPKAKPGPLPLPVGEGSRADAAVISGPPEEFDDQRRRAAVGADRSAHRGTGENHARGHEKDRGRKHPLLGR